MQDEKVVIVIELDEVGRLSEWRAYLRRVLGRALGLRGGLVGRVGRRRVQRAAAVHAARRRRLLRGGTVIVYWISVW